MAMLIKTNEDQKFWIDVDGSKFLVRPLTSSEDTAIANKHTEFKRGFPRADQDAIRKEKFRKTVLDWKNVEDINKQEVPFSEAMRNNFPEFNPDFAWRVIRQAEQHDVDDQEVEYDDLGKQSNGDALEL